MHSFELHAHPSTPTPFVHRVHVRLEIESGGGTHIVYEVLGDLEQLEIPSRKEPQRADGLWRNTCFEVFVRNDTDRAYEEWNFSPAGDWAAYRFTDYRTGMTPLDVEAEPIVRCTLDTHRFELDAAIARMPARNALRLGLSTVLRDRSGKIYYWALRHAPDKPDFHHPSSFAALLDGANSG